MPKCRAVPSFGIHKPSGQARVLVNGRHLYLGKFNSPESREKYQRVLAELGTRPARLETFADVRDGMTMVEADPLALRLLATSCVCSVSPAPGPPRFASCAPVDIDRSCETWTYKPAGHKTAHLGSTLPHASPPVDGSSYQPFLRRTL